MEPNTTGYAGNTYGTGFATAFTNYPLVGGQLIAAQNLSHKFEALWADIVACIPESNAILLGNIKTKLDEAYMFTGRAIAKPVVGGVGAVRGGAMSF